MATAVDGPIANMKVQSPESDGKSVKLSNGYSAKSSDSKASCELSPWPDYIQKRLDLWETYMARYVLLCDILFKHKLQTICSIILYFFLTFKI